jgi:signal transduction histidine kinase
MNLFSVSTVILCLSGIVFSLIIYRTDRTNKLNRAWFFSCIAFSIWALGLSGVTLSNSPDTAIWWQYVLDVSGIFLPYLYFIFVLELVGIKDKFTKTFLLICAIALAIFSFSPLFKVGMTIRYGFEWINPGSYYYLFLAYFVFYALLTISLLVYGYIKAKKKSILRYQIRNTIFGAIMGFGGGVTNFFPQLFSIYPYGNYFVILYIVFMVYGVLRYKLMSAKVIGAQVFSTALILVSLFNLLKANDINDWLLNFLTLVLVSILGIFLIQNVNQEVKAREALAVANKKLESSNKNLETANKAQSETMNFITHQIRGVFADTKAGLAAIIEGDLGAVADPMKNTVSRMLEAQNRGVSDVETFLKAVHIENGTVEYTMKSFDFKQLVNQIADQEKARAESKKLRYEVRISDGDYAINGDQTYLGQVVSNLIDNAIRYTPAGSIEIVLSRKDNKIIFSVKDSGVGVNEEDGKKLFTKYGHGKDSRRINTESNGLGLFIVKGIVDGHHGKIWYESAGTGKGTTFFVLLPVA